MEMWECCGFSAACSDLEGSVLCVMSVREDLFVETFILLLVSHCSSVWM